MRRPTAFALTLLLVGWIPVFAAETEAPISLSDPGGQGLALDKLDVRVAAHGPLALTELDMVFANPLDRQIEGKFVCILPTGATVSRFAKEINGQLMEGEVVERLRATQIYTEILHSMQDPALLEQEAGNKFKARIFPIPPRGTVRLLISYSSVNPVQADGQRKIVVPLRGLPKISRLKILALCRPLPGESVLLADASGQTRPMGTKDKISYSEEADLRDFTPKDDFVLAFAPGPQVQPVSQLVSGAYQVAIFRPPVDAKETAIPRDWTILVDTSASAASSSKARLDAIRKVLTELSSSQVGRSFSVHAFDLDVVELGRFKGGEGSVDGVVQAIEKRHFLGATDLEKALRYVGEMARKEKTARTFVLVTDGIPTVGTKDAGLLFKALGDWPQEATLHVLVIGSTQDESVNRAITTAGHGRIVTLPLTTALTTHARSAAMELVRPLGKSFQVYDEGAEWIEPKEFRDVRPGVELVAFSSLKKSGQTQVGLTDGHGLDLRPTGKPLEVPEFSPLLERESCGAYLTFLEHQAAKADDPAKKAELTKKRIEMSVRHRVLCPLTALLVLETESEYARYGIDRTALADIMVVGARGIEMQKRGSPPVIKSSEPSVKDQTRMVRMKKSKEARISTASRRLGGEFNESALQSRDSSSRVEGTEESKASGGAAPQSAAEKSDSSLDRMESLDVSAQPQEADGSPERLAVRERAAPPPPAAAPMASVARPMMAPQAEVGGASSRNPAPTLVHEDRETGAAGPADRVARTAIAGYGPQSSARSNSSVPAWVRQAFWKPDKQLLENLKERISKNPLDRVARNRLGHGLVRSRDFSSLVEMALEWQAYDPDNPMVYEYLGDGFSGSKDRVSALRALSSIAEVSPGDSGLLNRAGYLALRAGEASLAQMLFHFSIERRPDHVNNYRGLALSLWMQNRFEEALEALAKALSRDYHGRYGDVKRILREEAGLILGAWLRSGSSNKSKVQEIATRLGANPAYSDSFRCTLHWETDANDVDLHVVDPAGEECYYSNKQTASGLNLYEDLTQGLGPETATVPVGRLQKGVYHVGVTYFRAGPMGVSRGVVVIQWPSKDGKPVAQIEPFCLLPDLEGQSQDLRHVAIVETAGR